MFVSTHPSLASETRARRAGVGDLPGARDVELRWGWSQAQGVDTGVQQSDQHSPGQLTAPLTPSLFGSLNRPRRECLYPNLVVAEQEETLDQDECTFCWWSTPHSNW